MLLQIMDAYAGLSANTITGIQIFNEALVSEINRRGNLGIETGKLIFHSKNCHIYKTQFKMVEEPLKPKKGSERKTFRSKIESDTPTT